MRKVPVALGLSLVCGTFFSVGCSSSGSSQAGAKGDTAAPEKVSAPIPADSPFAKVKVGMGMKEVYDTIGQPTDSSGNITGKQFIPFYFGGDTHRVVAFYKGQGRITFSRKHAFTSDMRVIEIEYNPAESGYR